MVTAYAVPEETAPSKLTKTTSPGPYNDKEEEEDNSIGNVHISWYRVMARTLLFLYSKTLVHIREVYVVRMG